MGAAFHDHATALEPDVVAKTLTRRARLTPDWLVFLDRHPVLLLPVSGELPFDDGADLTGPEGLRRASRQT